MTTATNTYQTTKHLFEPLPNDSVTCRYCERSFSSDLHSNVPTPPVPDSGEWQVECQLIKVAEPPRGRVVIKDTKTLRIIACEDNPSRWDQALIDFEQIVADHNAVPGLEEALELAAKRLDFLTNWIENTYGGGNADVKLGRRYAEAARQAARHSTPATTTPPDAGEGR